MTVVALAEVSISLACCPGFRLFLFLFEAFSMWIVICWYQYWHCWLQVAGEVLSVVSRQSVEEAQKNATRNKITNCHYFSGGIEAVLLEVAKEIGYEKACAVMICNANCSTTCEYWRSLEWYMWTNDYLLPLLADFFEALVTVYQTKWRHIPEDHILTFTTMRRHSSLCEGSCFSLSSHHF